MKRNLALRELSVDHHHGLVQAHRAMKATEDAAEVASDFLAFWEREMSRHLREEEEILLPIFCRYGVDCGQEPVARMLVQHAQIRALVMELTEQQAASQVRPETLHQLGALSETHIRLEERVVFPAIETALPAEALQELGARLAADRVGTTG